MPRTIWASGSLRVRAPRSNSPDHGVAVADAAAGASLAHTAFEAAPRLSREVLQVERVHGALQADMQFADLALADGHDADAEKGEKLVEGRCVGLVARQAVEALRDHHLEDAVAAILQQLLVARPERSRRR